MWIQSVELFHNMIHIFHNNPQHSGFTKIVGFSTNNYKTTFYNNK